MELSPLSAISPVDGRYHRITAILGVYFSEEALMRYRVLVEVEYFIALCSLPLPQLRSIPKTKFNSLRKLYTSFSSKDALHIKDIEKVTNHDVKAVEYFLKERFNKLGLGSWKEFLHFGLTSQDINNTAVPLSLKEALEDVIVPELSVILENWRKQAKAWDKIPMLARTHGQPASPTRLGKEIRVFAERLEEQLLQLLDIPYSAKFGGATGNFNAHAAAYPNIDWPGFADGFVNGILELKRSRFTTQIEHYDNLASLFDCLKRINTIFIDFNRDIWTYISLEYFKQKIKKGEVGSSAMPHKVNPIDFENAEGNLGVANALFEHLSAKLPVSRLQRDLTDSTVLRTMGVPFAHSLIAYRSMVKGMEKLVLNRSALEKDLHENWAVVAEGIQTILRREGYPNPYEALKELTRKNEKITKESLHAFIGKLKVSDKIKKELKKLTPFNYTGV